MIPMEESFRQKANGLKVGDTLSAQGQRLRRDNESHSTATVKTTIVGIFKGDSARKVSSRAELTANTIYTDLDTTRDLYQYKDGKEIYQDATFVLSKGVEWRRPWMPRRNSGGLEQLSDHAQRPVFIEHAACRPRRALHDARRPDRRDRLGRARAQSHAAAVDERPPSRMGILVSLGVGKPSLVAQYLTEMVLIGLPSLALGWLCAQGMAQWLGTTALHSVNASAAKELSSMGQVGGDLESSMSVRTLDSLTVSVDGTAMLYVALGLLAVMLVCVAVACMPMLRKSPRDLSEIR